ncbi:MAG: dolichyl-phosphate beta-glucosyltransferase [Acidobacteriota bacterium]
MPNESGETIEPPYLSVIVPAFNEANRITKTLAIISAYLSRQTFASEVVVVVDGPSDATLDRVRDAAREHQNIRWIARDENRGKGYSVREGMLESRGTVRLFTDADNSTDIAHFDAMRHLFDAGCDLVIASRNPKDAAGALQTVPQPVLKRILGNFGNLFIQALAVPGIWDTQCGFKAFSAKTATEIFSRSLIDRWGFDIEALALSRALELKLGIVPAHWIDDPDTHVSPRTYLDVLAETVRIRWNLIRGVYDLPGADARNTLRTRRGDS